MVSPEVQGCISSLIYLFAAASAVWANSWDNMSYQTVINLKSVGKADWQRRNCLFCGYRQSKGISQKRDVPPAVSRELHVSLRITNLFISWSIHHLFSKVVLAGWHLSVDVGAQAGYSPFLERFRGLTPAKRTVATTKCHRAVWESILRRNSNKLLATLPPLVP